MLIANIPKEDIVKIGNMTVEMKSISREDVKKHGKISYFPKYLPMVITFIAKDSGRIVKKVEDENSPYIRQLSFV